MGVYQDVLPIFLRSSQVSLAAIGVLSSLSIAWSLKVFWSPLVDRFGERRQWIAGAQLALGLALAALALTQGSPGGLATLLWLIVAFYCIASATQDIAIDAYTIGIVDRGEEGPANSMRVIAYRVGLIAAGSGLMLLPDRIGWQGTFGAAAAISLGMAASVFACPRVEVPAAARAETRGWGSLRHFTARADFLALAAFILLFRIGDRAMGPMVRPFWVDRGFGNDEIALLHFLGPTATVLGALVGGLAVARLGIGRSLWLVGGLALASNLAYAGAALADDFIRPAVFSASVVESFCSGLAGVGFMSLLMRLCDKEHAAVQYASLTALYALGGSAVAVPSGFLAEALGYPAYFALTAGFALPAFLFLPAASRAAHETATEAS
jgi:PAT family beta-lactamase induction signal transducer AmpG